MVKSSNIGLGALFFVTGSVIGATVSWIVTKNAYQKKNQEDVNSVREFYKQKEKNLVTDLQMKYGFEIEEVEKKDETRKTGDVSLNDISSRSGPGSKIDYTKFYKDLSDDPPDDILAETPKPKLPPEAVPYVINPEEFGGDDYEPVSLTYYADGVLVDEDDEPVESIDEVVGRESLKRFGEFEADTVFVRNERLKCDYEVLRDNRKYSDIIEDDPFLKDRLQAMGVIDS